MQSSIWVGLVLLHQSRVLLGAGKAIILVLYGGGLYPGGGRREYFSGGLRNVANV